METYELSYVLNILENINKFYLAMNKKKAKYLNTGNIIKDAVQYLQKYTSLNYLE